MGNGRHESFIKIWDRGRLTSTCSGRADRRRFVCMEEDNAHKWNYALGKKRRDGGGGRWRRKAMEVMKDATGGYFVCGEGKGAARVFNKEVGQRPATPPLRRTRRRARFCFV